MRLAQEKFRFVSSAFPADAFSVVRFNGQEGLSQLYRFEITLLAEDPDLDLDKAMKNPASLVILRPDGNRPIHGVLEYFDVLHAVGDHVAYQATLVPNLWFLTLTQKNQIFLELSPKDFLVKILEEGGLSSDDFEFRLAGSPEPREYVCQYNETHFSFLSRWLEHLGWYYFFEHGSDHSKLIITDTKVSHTPAPGPTPVKYQPPTGLEAGYREDIISHFMGRRGQAPKAVQVRDYNYRQPSVEISGQAKSNAQSPGEMDLYGLHAKTPAEGQALARIRAEEFQARLETFQGSGTTSFLATGYLFTLAEHFRQSFNRRYLVGTARHQGSQAAFLSAGTWPELEAGDKEFRYKVDFTAIPAEVQFRPRRDTKKPRIYGTMHAKVDSAGSGEYAELDEQGRYKVILPFDASGRTDGKASHFLRMMQPYAGADHGLHFPLHKNAEVLLTFIDGDPDRPVIAGAVPNPNNPSLVKNKNQTQAVIQTGGQNKMIFEDKKDGQHVILKSPTANSYVRLGTKSEEEHEGQHEEGGFVIHTEGKFIKEIGSEVSLAILGSKSEVTVGAIEEITAGAYTEIVGGAFSEVIMGQLLEVVAGIIVEIKKGYCFEVGESTRLGVAKVEELFGSEKVEIKAGGPNPSIAAGVANAIQLAVSTTASAKAAASSKDGSKIVPAAIFSSIAAVNTILTTAMMVYLAKTKIPHSFKSTLEMDDKSIELAGPDIKVEAKEKSISLDAEQNVRVEARKELQMLGDKGVLISSHNEKVNVLGGKKVVISSPDGHIQLDCEHGGKIDLLAQNNTNINAGQVKVTGQQSVEITTDNFKWAPKTVGKFKAGTVEIDAATGQVKIG